MNADMRLESPCPKCGATRWSGWLYDHITKVLKRVCRGCSFEETKAPLDARDRR